MHQIGRQRGIGFVGLMMLLVIIGFIVLVGLRLFPVYMESFKIDAALKSVIEDPKVEERSKHEIITSLLRRFDIDDVRRITHRNYTEALAVTKEDGRVTITVDYRAEAPLFANLSLLADFHKEVSN